uniref:Uncharacterized protein n=1 Tax=Ascaris lumbricoides TaxID=6252 RepID=A0A0M3IRL8_ASCLU
MSLRRSLFQYSNSTKSSQAWNANVTIQPIRYERESRLLSSDAGIVRIVYITGCVEARMMSYLTYPSVKQLQLDDPEELSPSNMTLFVALRAADFHVSSPLYLQGSEFEVLAAPDRGCSALPELVST